MDSGEAVRFVLLVPFVLISLSALAQEQRVTDSIPFDDARKTHWPAAFLRVDIPSSADTVVQRAFFYRAESVELRPLIVSLHS